MSGKYQELSIKIQVKLNSIALFSLYDSTVLRAIANIRKVELARYKNPDITLGHYRQEIFTGSIYRA